MKSITLFLLSIMILAGCASKPDYRPANNGSEGYSEQKLTDDRYRVQFTIYSRSVADATDYALLRSAELTQEQGYDWFVVTSKETFVESQEISPSTTFGATQRQTVERRCGLLTCDTYRRPSTELGVSISSGSWNNKKEINTILDIRLGKGMRPNDDSYSAQDVIDNLSKKK